MYILDVEIEISTPYNFNLNYFNFLTFLYIDTVMIQSLKYKHNYSVLMVVIPPML